MALTPSAVAQQYFDAWNRRDADGIVATFLDGGTYQDPGTPAPLTGKAIGAYATGIWAAFPDLSFEIASVVESGAGLVAAEWIMRGTNLGSFAGLPPTGRSVELHGADFLRVEGDKLRSVIGYFDNGVVPRALGLDVVVQPKQLGPFTFGIANRVTSGKSATPGAFAITCLETRSAAEAEAVRQSSQKIIGEMLGAPGFISFVGVTVGDRMMTISAWESPDSMTALMKSGEHRSAAGRFYGPEIARGGATGVWVPHRLNPRWVRCDACAKMADSEKTQGKCACGAALAAPIAYW